MAIIRDLIKVQGQFKVATPTGDDACDIMNNETGEVILEQGTSYSQTISVSLDATDDQIKGFMEAVLSLCTGVREYQDGVDLQGEPCITKKIISTHVLINE